MQTKKLLNGWYRVSGEHYFSNVKRGRHYGSDQWSNDLRRRDTGDLVELGSLHCTKRDAVEEAERIIARADERYIPSPSEVEAA